MSPIITHKFSEAQVNLEDNKRLVIIYYNPHKIQNIKIHKLYLCLHIQKMNLTGKQAKYRNGHKRNTKS